MLNTKFIKIIIIIAIILILAFIFLFVRKNNQAIVPENTNSTSTLTGINGRPVLNTNTSNKDATFTDNNVTNTETTYTNVNPADYANSGSEDILQKKIEKILFNWGVTKDEKSLRDAVALSENTDNEAILSAWISFMKTDSAELVKIINTSTDIKRTKNTVSTIFQWFIDLSGEYEKLSTAKRQQITNQYNQLK